MSVSKSVLKGSFVRALELFVSLGAAFFVTPYFVHSVGDRLYGFWALVGTFVGYYGYLELGLSGAVARYVSQALARGEARDVDDIASTAFFLFNIAALLVVALTALSAALCPVFVRDPAEAALLRKLVGITGLASALMFPPKVYSGMLTAGIRFDTISWVSIARSVAVNVGICACLAAGFGIVSVAGVTLAVSALYFAAMRAACRRAFPTLKLSLFRPDRAKARLMAGYGSTTLVCHLGDILRFRLDNVLIAAYLGAGSVTPYSVATRLIDGFGQLVLSFVGTMFPVFSRYEGRGDYDAIRGALVKVTRLGTMLTAFIGLSVIFYGRAFIRRWMGPGFDASYGVVAILSAAFLIGLPQSPGIQMLYGLSKHKFYAVLSIVEGVFNLALSLLLLRRFGIYGVALGTLAEMAFFKLTVQPVYICRAISLPVRAYLFDSIFIPLVKTALPLAGYFLAVSRFLSADYRSLGLLLGLQTALFVPVAYFLVMGPAERQVVEGALRSLFGGRRAAAGAIQG